MTDTLSCEIDVEDWYEFCRVCLTLPDKDNQLDINLIYDEEEELTYAEVFEKCTKIDLKEDNAKVPQSLCKSCGLELQMAYDFWKKVHESKRVLCQLQGQLEFNERQVWNECFPDDVDNKYLPELSKRNVKANKPVKREHFVKAESFKTDPIETDSIQTEIEEGAEEFETAVEIVTEMEEHLDVEEYQTVEELDDEDAETIQNKIEVNNTNSFEELIFETIANKDYDDEEIEEDAEEYILHSKSGTVQMPWQQAVVAVANESHLPIKAEAAANEEMEYQDLKTNNDTNDDTCLFEYATEEEEETGYEVNEIGDIEPRNAKRKANAAKPSIQKDRKRFVGKFSCEYCQKIFPNHSRMALHRRLHQSDRPKYPCTECSRIYSTKQALDVHIRSGHLKTGGYNCTICSKNYAIKKGLEIHMRYHTGDFPYACDLCERKFAQVGHLNTHKAVKHNSVRFCCEHPDCGKYFTSSASLRNHEFSHGPMPFECEFCQRGYPAKSKLRVHIRRTHGEEMTLDELEKMRKFHVTRSKLNLVKVVECEIESEV